MEHQPKKEKPHHVTHINRLLIIVIILAIIIIILVNPALTGYKIKSEFEKIELSTSGILEEQELTKSKLMIAEANLTVCSNVKESLMSELTNVKSSTSSCLQDKDVIESTYTQLSNEYKANLTRIRNSYEQDNTEFVQQYNLNISLINSELEQAKTNYNTANTNYNALVTFSGRNICCKAKIDDGTIDSYEVANNKVICTAGGENTITC